VIYSWPNMSSFTFFILAVLSVFFLSTFVLSSSPANIHSVAPNCGIGKYDFSSLTAKGDWVGLSPDYSNIYYLNLCNTVKNLWCTLNSNTASVQVCQTFSGNTGETYSVMGNDPSQTKWTYINGKDGSAGIQFESHTGEGTGGCPGSKPRAAIGEIVCGNTTGIITDITENPACTYILTIPTPMMCSGTESPEEIATVDTFTIQKIKEIQKRVATQH